jgi:fructose-bisphosphate aldolase, class I
MTDLSGIARSLVAPGKGILAADESPESADKRLASFGIRGGEEMRRKDRDLLLAAPGIEEYLTGVILHEETLSQCASDGTPFPKLLLDKGIIPGIKVDQGLEPMPHSPDETITKGLLGLGERLSAYREQHGTGFTKWRAVIRIEGDRLPTSQAIVENAKRLASYACEVQKAGMVPMLEPEVLLEGSHSRIRCREVLQITLQALMDELLSQCADPSAVIVKTSMVLSGSSTNHKDAPEDVARDTYEALRAAIPAEVPGIVFLSGGQTPDQATDNLRALSRIAREEGAPWPMTYSYSRALQEEALRAWEGKDENVDSARHLYMARLKAVSDALKG